MLKQLKGKSSDETLDDIDADDEFSDLGVLDDSNSMYMVGNACRSGCLTASWAAVVAVQ